MVQFLEYFFLLYQGHTVSLLCFFLPYGLNLSISLCRLSLLLTPLRGSALSLVLTFLSTHYQSTDDLTNSHCLNVMYILMTPIFILLPLTSPINPDLYRYFPT